MKTLKTILKFVGLFILIKVIFFFFHNIHNNEIKSPNATDYKTSEPTNVQNSETNNTSVPHHGYHRFMAGYGVSVELPESWYILSDKQVQNIKQKPVSVQFDNDTNKVTSIAANSDADPKKNQSVFRISFTESSFSSNDLVNASSQEISEVCSNLGTSLLKSLPLTGSSLTKQPECHIGSLSKLPAFVSEYERESVNKDGNWKVIIYQIPLKNNLAIVTGSYNLKSQEARQSIEKALYSISLQLK